MRRLVILFSIVFVVLAVWLTDFVTLKGEHTVYTARCEGGAWHGNTCTGMLRAGERYRFRALKAHREVFYWTARKPGTSGKLTDCDITNRSNWRCRPTGTLEKPVTVALAGDMVVPTPSSQAVHAVSKGRCLMRFGLPAGSDADS